MKMKMKMKMMEAIKSIPEKKEKLREAFESLQSYSSSSSFNFNFNLNLQWEDIDNHFSAIEKSIDHRIRALQAKEASIFIDHNDNNKHKPEIEPEAATLGGASARPELRSLCVNMDAKGLCSYITDNWSDVHTISNELASAIRCAPDPPQLVLDSVDDFYTPNFDPNYEARSERKYLRCKRVCIKLLEALHLIIVSSETEIEIKPSVRENAKKLATQWKSNISPGCRDYAVSVTGFLQLIASYGLVPDFRLDDVLDLFVSVTQRKHEIDLSFTQRKHAIDLIKSLGLVDHNKLPHLIQKLNSKGRQLDAVKFVYAFNATDKFPPVPLLLAFETETNRIAEQVRKNGKYSMQALNEAAAKELSALRSVIQVISEYNLESGYPCEQLERRISVLEQKRGDKKRTGTGAVAASNSN